MISTNCTKNKTCAMNDVLQPKVHGKFMVRKTLSLELKGSGKIIIILFGQVALFWTIRQPIGCF